MFNWAGIPFLKEKPLSSLSGLAGGATAFQVKPAAGETGPAKALRFNDDDTTHLTRTPSSAGNRKTWTWSAWVKRSGLGLGGSNTEEVLFSCNAGTSDPENAQIQFGEDDDLQLLMGYPSHDLKTTANYKDTGEWYHFVVAVDVTQGTASNKVKMYVNGDQITDFATDQRSDYTNTDWAINMAQEHKIGNKGNNTRPFHGYMLNIHMIDGLQLTPTSFAEADGTTGQWIPKEYSGAYGTNGFFLEFADNSAASAAALGKDSSGNGHNWTPTNFSVASGAGNDSLLDSPTLGDTADDTGAGGEITGNYCTLNPLDAESAVSLKQGNLQMDSSGDGSARGTIANVDQKWYFEATVNSGPGASQVGVHNAKLSVEQFTSDHMDYRIDNGEIYGGSGSHPGTTFGVGDTIGVAVNKADATGTISFYKNGSLIQTRNLSAATNDNPVVPNTRTPSSGVIDFNFGQRAFRNAAPAGYKCWAAPNLAAPAITKPIEHFDVALYTGTGSGLSVSSLEFQPDFTWIKSRTDSNHNHLLYDDIRGSTKYLSTNGTGHGDTASLAWSPSANGFTISTNSNYNTNGHNYVSWNWKAATSQGNSNGENITVASGKQQVNTTAGFSITEFTGDGSGSADSDSGDSVGHGLSKAPEWLMLKRFDTAQNNWICWHKDFGNAKMIHANTTGARSGTNYCIPTAPTSTKVDLGNNPEANASGHKYMLYCWHGVEGYCKIGTYEGGTVGTFVHTGFAPMLIWVKNSDMGPSDWTMLDRRRESINPNNNWLPCNHGGPELQQQTMNFLSNGFTLQSTSEGSNHPSGTYIYMAWAQHPFKTTRAY